MKEEELMQGMEDLEAREEAAERFAALSAAQQEVWRLRGLALAIADAGGYVPEATLERIEELAAHESEDEDEEQIMREVSSICHELWRELPRNVEEKLPVECFSWRYLGGYAPADGKPAEEIFER